LCGFARARPRWPPLRPLCRLLPRNADLAGCGQPRQLPEGGPAPRRGAAAGNGLRLPQGLTTPNGLAKRKEIETFVADNRAILARNDAGSCGIERARTAPVAPRGH